MSDHWDYYLCHIDNRPASIFVDMDLRGQVPIRSLPTLVILRLGILHPQEQGMPTDAEFDTLCDIEDALTESLDGCDAEVVYVGRVTCGGRRDFFFYSDNGYACESFFGQAMAAFGDYEFGIVQKEDQQWECFREFLAPTPHDEQGIQNRHVLKALEEAGDNHESPRAIHHWLYFSSPGNRSEFQTSIAELNFAVECAPDEPNDEGEYALQVSRVDPVTWSHINQVTIELLNLATEHSGTYDGWETSVAKD